MQERSHHTLFFCLIAVLVATSCERNPTADALQTLADADQLELLSIDPDIAIEPSPDQYLQWKRLGSIRIAEPAKQAELIGAFRDSVRNSNGRVMTCFEPRHAIRVTKGTHITEFVICFHCKQIWVYADGQRSDSLAITLAKESAFDDMLESGGVPLAPKAAESRP